jgi:hypothetical protein
VPRERAADEVAVAQERGEEHRVARAARQEQLRNRLAVGRRSAGEEVRHQREVNRPVAVSADGIGIGAGVQQNLDDRKAAPPRGVVEGGIAGLVRRCRDTRILRELGLDPGQIAGARRLNNPLRPVGHVKTPRQVAA